jgi:putative transposase
VSRQGYYKWSRGQEQQPKDYGDYLLVKEIFEKGKKKLGWRPIQMRLNNDYGLIMNHKKIRRIMTKYGLSCQVRRKNPYKKIMKKTQEHRTFENVLARNFKQAIPRKVLCTDITYVYYGNLGKKAFLSAVKDISSGEAVAWEASQNLELEFVLRTVDQLKELGLPPDCLIHSDQGFHYTNPLYQQRIKQLNIIQSMSRKGSCIDNAPMESFFGHLKDEVDFKGCNTFSEVIIKIKKYMQYYNHDRYQWGLKKMTPVQYRDHLLAASAA